MKTFADLRLFARDTIPLLLLEAGGEMSKEQMHQLVERLYAQGKPMPEELDCVSASGTQVKRNAVAWAMRDLVMDGILERSSGRSTVRLSGPKKQAPADGQSSPGEVSHSHEERLKARAGVRAAACRARARKERVPFDESIVASAGEQIERQRYRCSVTGIPFNLDEVGEGAGGSHYAPSPDRVVPSLGYVAGNVRWVLWMVNRAKGRMTEEQFLDMCRAAAARPPG